MFTGIISAIAPIQKITLKNGNSIFSISLPPKWDLEIGESINVNGVCSTVIQYTDSSFDVEYMQETLRLTTMNEQVEGAFVNLEKSVTMQTALSGHIVSGHVDTTGVIQDIQQEGDSYRITVTHDAPQYVIHKGSIAINGVSLTVIDPTDHLFSVALIPHTWQETQFSFLKEGERVNLEYDMIAKYIERYNIYGTKRRKNTITDSN